MSMIDITSKPEVYREAVARGSIKLRPETVRRISEGSIEKGDPLSVAMVAGILAAKKTSSLIPLCHPMPLTNVDVDLEIADESTVKVEATVKATGKTGVEMEALTAATVALLTVWDMTKKYEKDDQGQYPTTSIESIRVIRKIKRNIT